MLNIQVRIGTDVYELEFYQNDPINLSYRFTDIAELNKSVGSFSKSFRIPATQKNIECFGTFFNPNLVDSFNPKQKADATLSFNTIPLMNGYIQLKGAYIQKEKYADFEIVFFGESVNLARALGDSKLKDLDLSDYDHTVNYDNVTDSWDGNLFSGKLKYGLIDKGFFYGGTTPLDVDNPLVPNQFTPFLRVNELVSEIFTQNGFTLDSDFLTNQTEIYTPFFNGRQSLQTSEQLGLHTIQVGLTADDVQAVSGLTNYVPSGMSETTPFYDAGGNFDTATDAYTPPYDAQFVMYGQVAVEWNATQSESADISIQIRNITDGVNIYSTDEVIIPNGGEHVFLFSETQFLDSTKEYALSVNVISSAGSITIKGDNTTGLNSSFWSVFAYGEPLSTFTLDLAANAPNIKQIDYLTSLQKMFNLVFVPDRNDPTKITVEPFKDYTTITDIKDWTDLISYDKDVSIKPTTDIQYKKYEFTYSEGKDFINKLFQDNANRTFGRYLIEDTENDFSTSELTVKPDFGAYPLQAIEGTNLLIHKSMDEQGAPITDPLCRVVFWGGKKPVTGLFIKDGLTTITETDYPYFGHYDEVNPSVTDNDLNYGGDTPVYPIDSNPNNNLYNVYWRPYVDQLYSSEARTMDAYFNLSVPDVADFRFNDKIWIKDSYWRILELDHSPNSNDLTKVKLLKLIDAVRACEWLPYQSLPNGSISFIDTDGTIGAPTQSCCELFGYQFIDSACYYQNTDVGGFNRPNPSIFGGVAGSDIVNGIAIGNNLSGRLRNLIQGRSLSSSFDDVVLLGSNGKAIAEGFHRGGGWWHKNFGTGTELNQYGQITFIYEGDFDDNDVVELFIEGRLNNRLNIPDDSGISVNMNVNLTTLSAASSNVVKSENYIFNEVLLKIGGVASTKNGGTLFEPDIAVGTFSSSSPSVKMGIDTTSDTTQHRITLNNHNITNTDKTRIICVMNYTMAKF